MITLSMNYICTSFVILLALLLSSEVKTEDPISHEKKVLIDELSIAQGDRLLSQQMAEMMANEMKQFTPFFGDEQQDFTDIFSRIAQETIESEFINSGELQKLNHDLWGESLDNSELKELIQFYQTPLGKKLVEVQPDIGAKTIDAFLDLQQRIAPIIAIRVQQEMNYNPNSNLSNFSPTPSSTSARRNGVTEEELDELRAQVCSETRAAVKRLPVLRDPPWYPTVAAAHGIEGFVDLKFNIEADGSTSDVNVIKTSVGSLFNSSAIDAVSNYIYCGASSSTTTSIRLRFEMEDSYHQEKKKIARNGKDLSFIKSKTFRNDIESYKAVSSRKAFAVASDGGDIWASAWRYGHRTQQDANRLALQDCNSSRRKFGIQSACKLMFKGHDLNKSFQSSDLANKTAKKLEREDFEEQSEYEKLLDFYGSKAEPKALALAEGKDGAYWSYYAYGQQSQKLANSMALKGCNDEKSAEISGECELFMIGEYVADKAPQLNTMKGMWEGELHSMKARTEDAETEEYESYLFKLDNCGDRPVILRSYQEDKGKFREFGRVLDIKQDSGNIVMTSVSSKPSWAETQIWALAELSDTEAVVQWSRLVHNLTLEMDEHLKEFGYWGGGKIFKQPDGCSGG